MREIDGGRERGTDREGMGRGEYTRSVDPALCSLTAVKANKHCSAVGSESVDLKSKASWRVRYLSGRWSLVGDRVVDLEYSTDQYFVDRSTLRLVDA